MSLKQKIFYAICGFFIGNAILLGLVLGIKIYTDRADLQNITVEKAIYLIDEKQIKSAKFKQSGVVLEDKNGNQFETILGSDINREIVFDSINEHNRNNIHSLIKYSEEPANPGWGWIVLLNFLPFAAIGIALFIFMGAFFMGGRKGKLN